VRGVYTANFQTVSLSAGPQTLLQLTAPPGACIEILEAFVTDLNNANNQQLEIFLQRASAAGGSPTVLTPSKHEPGDQASASTVGAVPTSEPTYTANTKLGMQGVPSVGGYQFAPIPEKRPIVPPSGIIGLKINTPSFAATIFDVELTYREIG